VGYNPEDTELECEVIPETDNNGMVSCGTDAFYFCNNQKSADNIFLSLIPPEMYWGLGLSFSDTSDGILIEDIDKTGPAYENGLRVGDMIIRAKSGNNEITIEMGVEQLAALIQAPYVKKLEITLIREESQYVFTVTKDVIDKNWKVSKTSPAEESHPSGP
jgi:C-terminal processing protease CtpA/Prc